VIIPVVVPRFNRAPQSWRPPRLEDGEVDGIRHRLVAGVVWVQVVTAVVGGQQMQGVGWVADGLVEVDDAVEGAARADPVVDRFA
jgi:hypothetical protein